MNEDLMFITLDYYVKVIGKDAEEGTLEKNVSNAIEMLVEKYNKQKERIAELEEIEKEHQKQNGELQEKLKFCKVHNLPENVESIVFYKEDFERNFGNDFISKNKIKAKIEELENKLKDFENTDNTGRFKKENCIHYYKIEVLQELLEE